MKKSNRFTRRGILQAAPAAAAISLANAQEKRTGPQNAALEAQNPDSAHSPETDSGTVSPFKYSFALAHTRFGSGGWTRQVTARELPISKDIAGVEMRLKAGGVRELH